MSIKSFLTIYKFENPYFPPTMPQQNKISFTVNNIPAKRNSAMDGMIALKKIQHFSYALSDQIGLGYSSHVYKGKNDKTNQLVAVKVIDIKKEDELHRQFTNNEVNILEKIKNIAPDNLLKLQGVFKTKNNLYIITEFCEGKDLAKILRRKKHFTEQQAQGIMKQFLKGYGQLYGLRIVHRDLKLANIFIRKGKAILADLGFAIQAQKCTDKFDYNVGSPFYMPPQSLKFNRYSYKSDVWAIGVIAFELVYGQRPWKDKDDDILYEKIMNTSIDELFDSSVRVSEQYKQFIRECLQVDFERRAGPQYVINFNWPMANDYIEGLDEPSYPQRPKPLSISKLPHNAPMSAKHMTYKPIQFQQLRENKILKNQNGQFPVSLMGRQPSPHKDNIQLRKKNLSSDQAQKHHDSSYHYQPLMNHRNKRLNTMDNLPATTTTTNYTQTDVQKVILAQIQYCRFLNLVFDQIRASGLDQLRDIANQLAKKVINNIQFLVNLQFEQENQLIPGLRKYLGTDRWRHMNQMIFDYKEKYHSKYFLLPIRETPQLTPQSVGRTVSQLKTRLQQYERLIELLVYVYQVLILEQNSDLIRFAKESRIEYLAENKNVYQNPGHTQRLVQKLQYMEL